LFDLGAGAPAIRSITFTDRLSSASAGRDDILTGTFTFSADNSFAPESGAPEAGDVRVSFTDDAPGGGSPATTIIPTGLTTGFQFVRFDVGTAGNPGDPGNPELNTGASDISFFANVVPEPAGLSALALGGLALAARRRGRRA
jgi:hypothetical protein